MSLPEDRIVLGDCGHSFRTQVWRSVSTADSELVERFLQGTLNFVSCPSCGELTDVRSPLLFHDRSHGVMVFIYDPDLNGDPLLTLNPELKRANAALGIEMTSADSFEAAREALVSLNKPYLLPMLRVQSPQSTDAQLCADYIRTVVEQLHKADFHDVDDSLEWDATGQNEPYAGEDLEDLAVAELSPAERAKAIIEEHQRHFEAKQLEIVERIARQIPPEKTFREAFRESSQPDAPSPPGWWFVPALGLAIGLGLIKYAGRLGAGIGALLAIFTQFFSSLAYSE
jgi:hypothetical protein